MARSQRFSLLLRYSQQIQGGIMKTRTKWFLGVLTASIIIAVASGTNKGANNGAGLIKLMMLFFVVWVVWRGFVFLWTLLTPVRRAVQPVTDHVDDALRRSGLGFVADTSNKLQAAIDGAVNASQKGIDERSK
jgi:hypothetical protein